MKNKPILKQVFKFDQVALILGFIVDSITLVSIILALDLSERIPLPGFISPGLAFSIWLLAVYVYLAFLHSYWEKHQSEKNLASKFGVFLAKDLVLRFRYPPLLLPMVVSIVILCWIIYLLNSELLWGLLCLVAFVGFISFFVAKAGFIDFARRPDDEFRALVEENWEFLEERINLKLRGAQWVSHHDLEDVAIVLDVSRGHMCYVLAKYAVEHPESTAYGQVIRLDDDTPVVSGCYNQLISLKNIDNDRFYYE